MWLISLAALLLLGSPQQPDTQSPQPDVTPSANQVRATPLPKQIDPEIAKKIADARAKQEVHRQAARRINELAANIHSEKDARAFIDAVAEELTHHKHLLWAAQGIRHRVARAEYASVSDSGQLIPDQRIADVWNEYARELDAPEEVLVTVAEVHQERVNRYRAAKLFWSREYAQSIWNMPNIHAVAADGQVAEGARALEAVDTLYNMGTGFATVLGNRERLQKRADTAGPTGAQVIAWGGSTIQFRPQQAEDPIRPAIARYVEAHGQDAYDRMLKRLFNELFPQ